jgi:alpha-L-rhamnosidase
VLGVMLGNGWWSKPFHIREPAGSEASKESPRYPATVPPQFILQTANVHIAAAVGAGAGAAAHLASGPGLWEGAVGPVVYDSLWDGETYDATRELVDDATSTSWSQAGYPARSEEWKPPVVATAIPRTAILSSPMFPPVRITREWLPVSVTQPRPGVFVVDFGQNIAGLVRLRVHGARGTRVQLRHAEILVHVPYCGGSTGVACDGMIYNNNLRSARATDVYILSGHPDGETYMPR